MPSAVARRDARASRSSAASPIPAVVWAIGQAAFNDQANGSRSSGRRQGRRLEHDRPDVHVGPLLPPGRPRRHARIDYDASTLRRHPTSARTRRTSPPPSRTRLKAVAKAYGVAARRVPADMVTASFSGLDPDISRAERAASRRPSSRRRAASTSPKVLGLMLERTDAVPTLGFLGTTRINVLDLNLALDRIAALSGAPARAASGARSRTEQAVWRVLFGAAGVLPDRALRRLPAAVPRATRTRHRRADHAPPAASRRPARPGRGGRGGDRLAASRSTSSSRTRTTRSAIERRASIAAFVVYVLMALALAVLAARLREARALANRRAAQRVAARRRSRSR